VSEDPQFIDAAADDYRLKETSPCIDAGIRYYWSLWPERDRNGNCRLRGASVDIGCYEFGASRDADGDLLSDTDETTAGTDANREDTDGDGLRDGLEAIRGSDPLNPTAPQVFNVPESILPIQKALCLAVEGDVVVVAPGAYQENLEFCGPDVILRSSDPLNAIVVASTVLDAGGARPIVFKGTETPACVLSGVTVRNGNAEWGGGVAGNGTHATIENNTITGNHAWNGGGLEDCDGFVRKNVVIGNSAAVGGRWRIATASLRAMPSSRTLSPPMEARCTGATGISEKTSSHGMRLATPRSAIATGQSRTTLSPITPLPEVRDCTDATG